MFEFLKTERFNYVFSFLIGMALISLLKPKCKDDCHILKAAPVEEVKESTYQIGGKCYQFTPELVGCPAPGTQVIEPFERS